MERETGIEPATNSLEGCDSTTELLPPSLTARYARNFGGQARYFRELTSFAASAGKPALLPRPSCADSAPQPLREALPWLAIRSRERRERLAKDGGEGRIRTFEAAGATDLQSVAFDRFATSPKLFCRLPSPRPPHVLFRRLRQSRQKPLQLSQPPSAWNERSSARRVTPTKLAAWLVTWSWRRDLNPRPADYKSAALPD
jgi:hypothetical protein